MAFDPNYPCGWNYEGSVSTHWTSFLNLLQHEARNLVVVLMEEMHGYNMCIYWALETWMASVWYPQPVCTTSSWWQQSLYCGTQTSAGSPESKEGETCFHFCSVKDAKQMFRTTTARQWDNHFHTFPHCLHLPSCRLRCTQWWRTTMGWAHTKNTAEIYNTQNSTNMSVYSCDSTMIQRKKPELTSRIFLDPDSLNDGLHLKLIWSREEEEGYRGLTAHFLGKQHKCSQHWHACGTGRLGVMCLTVKGHDFFNRTRWQKGKAEGGPPPHQFNSPELRHTGVRIHIFS